LDVSDDHELAAAGDRERAGGVLGHRETSAEHERREQDLGDVLGERCDRREDHRRRATDVDVDRHGLVELFVALQVEAAALADLHVQSAGRVVEALDAVHAEIGAEPFGMLGPDQRERDEGAAVLGPGAQQRQARKTRRRIDDLRDRRAALGLAPDLGQRHQRVALLPELARARRHQLVRKARDALDQLLGATTEGQLDAPRRAKQIGHDGPVGALDVLEEQRRTAGCDHAAVDFGSLEVRVDRRLDLDQLALTAIEIEEGAEVAEAGGGIQRVGTGHVGALRGQIGSVGCPCGAAQSPQDPAYRSRVAGGTVNSRALPAAQITAASPLCQGACRMERQRGCGAAGQRGSGAAAGNGDRLPVRASAVLGSEFGGHFQDLRVEGQRLEDGVDGAAQRTHRDDEVGQLLEDLEVGADREAAPEQDGEVAELWLRLNGQQELFEEAERLFGIEQAGLIEGNGRTAIDGQLHASLELLLQVEDLAHTLEVL
jgi:hypothetical protein